ncbi:MarR family transcriptional regulator [Candidatus Methanomethylophilus sp. 1R26]|uniref:MarR family transcriptional regulator n=1 Tax=Candidatus Methanomethylophilus sp. 1R26 TaxID=1769296 RepID=UPI0012FEBD5F|nr:MarR family transcriptional regulator [Candidatus Methanomethylophilus sp. 1R26]
MVTLEFTRERAAASFRSEMPTLTENEKRILDTLRLHPDYTLTKIASLSGMSRSYVGKTVSKMKKMGLVERIGSNKSGSWAVKDRIDRKR